MKIDVNPQKIFAYIISGLIVWLLAGCTPSQTTTGQTQPRIAAAQARTVQVTRGTLDITVSVDGNLNMPQAFNLHFGAPGDVKDVYVKEGDRVKAGAILARLDDTAQRLDIKSSNIGVQQTLSNLYETVPRLPQFPTTFYAIYKDTNGNPILDDRGNPIILEKPRWDWEWDYVAQDWKHSESIPDSPFVGLPVGYPAYYANSTAIMAYNWAVEEIASAQSLFLSENYTAAASQLKIALADLECSLKILEDAVLNPASGLGNVQSSVPEDIPGYTAFQIQQDNSFAGYMINEIRNAMSLIRQGQDSIDSLLEAATGGKKEEAQPIFNSLMEQLNRIGRAVMNNVNVIQERSDTEVYGKDISNYLYGAASDKLDAALKGIEKDGVSSPDLAINLTIAEHYMKLCNAILGTNDYVLQHGLSLKNENQYKVDLESKLVDLSNKRDDFLKTVIMTPVDGIVVSVAVKKNDVLSSQDYSSKGTIQVVDTSQIKFVGTVDEIDILKIKTGQKAAISVDAIPDKTFGGRVSFISPYGTASTGGVVKFNVTVLLDPTDVDLKGGLTATADIAVKSIENALLLPVTAVTTTKEGSFVNLVVDSTGKTEKKQVTLGEQNQLYVQILSGLKEGDHVTITERATGVTTRTTMAPPAGGGGPPPP